MISETAVGFIFCLPLKNPLKDEKSGTKNSAGDIALIAGADLGLLIRPAIRSAPKKHIRNPVVPIASISSIAT